MLHRGLLFEVQMEPRHGWTDDQLPVAIGRDEIDVADLKAAAVLADLESISDAFTAIEDTLGIARLDVAGCSDGIEEIRRSVQIGIFFLIVADAIKQAAAAADDGGLKCKSVGDLLLGVEHDLLCPGIGENLARGAIERKPA